MTRIISRVSEASFLKLLDNGDLEVNLEKLAIVANMPPTQENFARLSEIVTQKLSDEPGPEPPEYSKPSDQYLNIFK